MNHVGWSVALFWACLGASVAFIVIGTYKPRRRRNRRIGLPAPECDRVPDWHVHAPIFTRRQAE